MVEPLRHRQTKEADNRYVRPTATAPHLNSTKTGKAQNEQMFSGMPPCVDGSELARTFFTYAELVGAPMCSAC